MAGRVTYVSWAVLLTGAVWLADTGSGLAQAAAEAAAGAAAASSVGGTAKAAGQAIGLVLGRAGAKVETSTQTAAPAASTRARRTKAQGAAPRSTEAAPASFPAREDGSQPGTVTVVGPTPHIHFDVVSFKRCAGGGSSKVDLPTDGDYVAYHCQPVFRIIDFAYTGASASNSNLSGYPSWVDTDLYDFEAKVAAEDIPTWQKMGLNARRVAVRRLLAEELKLKIHVDTTPKPVYTLSVAKNGPKLKMYTEGGQETLPNGQVLNGKNMTWVGPIAYFQDGSMGNLVELLSAHLDRQVLNQTGLTGSYDFSLPLPQGTGISPNAGLTEDTPPVAEALSGLGLKLEAGKTEVDGIVVDHIERPAED